MQTNRISVDDKVSAMPIANDARREPDLAKDRSQIETKSESCIVPVDPSVHPSVFKLLREAIDNVEGENAEELFKKRIEQELNTRVAAILKRISSENVTQQDAANQLQALTETGVDIDKITQLIRKEINKEKDPTLKVLYASVLCLLNNPWENIFSVFQFKFGKENKDFWISYLKNKPDSELKSLFQKPGKITLHLDDEEIDRIRDSLLELRDENFIIQALTDSLKNTRDVSSSEIITRIITSILKKEPEAASYNLLEGLYRTCSIKAKGSIAEALVSRFPNEALNLFLEVVSCGSDTSKSSAIGHCGIVARTDLNKRSEIITKLTDLMNNSYGDFAVLVPAIETLLSTKSFGKDGKKALVCEIEKEIYEVAKENGPVTSEATSARPSNKGKEDRNVAVLDSPSKELSFEPLRPYKLAIVTWLSGCMLNMQRLLIDVYSKRYENNALANAYKMANGMKICYMDGKTSPVTVVVLNSGKRSIAEIISHIGARNLLIMCGSDDEILRQNALSVFEITVSLSDSFRLRTYFTRDFESAINYNNKGLSGGEFSGLIYELADRVK